MPLDPVQFICNPQAVALVHTTEDPYSVSAGHAPVFVPLQVSAGSHTPVEARQIVPLALASWTGHVPLDPVQFICNPQAVALVHTTEEPNNTSIGHWPVFVPLQVSGGSQTPVEARQMVPLACAN